MRKYPFIKFSLVFILGILLNKFFPLQSSYLFLPIAIVILLIVITYNRKDYSIFGKVFLISFYLFFALLGSLIHALKIESNIFLDDDYSTVEKMVVIGKVKSIDLMYDNEVSFLVESDSIRIEKKYHVHNILVLCKVRDTTWSLGAFNKKIAPGNTLRVEGTFQKRRERRNPGEVNYNEYLKTQGISGLLYVKDDYEVKILNSNNDAFKTFILNLRRFLDEKITGLHNPQASGLIRGLILADRSGIDYQTKTEFVNSGVMHILAVSGLHVGFIILIFIFLFGRFNIYARALLTMLGLIIFLFITGASASVFRAVTMALVIGIAQITNRSSNIFNSLAIAAFIVLVFNPLDLFSAGFQLSFLAVLSIAVIYPIIQNYIYKLKLKSKVLNYILLFMGVSLSAQIGTLPLTMIYFGKISLVSLITNLFVIPLAGVIVGIAIFTLILSLVMPGLASIYGSVNEFIIFILYKIISYSGGSEYSFVYIRNFTLYDTIIFYITIILIVYGVNRFQSSRGKIVFVFLAVLNSVIFSSLDNQVILEKGKLNLLMIDVGQGNSTLIKLPNDQTVLINAGRANFYFEPGQRVILPMLNYLAIEKIDYAVVSNLSQENISGFVSLVRSGIIRKIIKPGRDSLDQINVRFEELANLYKVPISYINTNIHNLGGVNLYTFNSSATLNNPANPQKECLSVIEYGNTNILIAGELSFEMDEHYSNLYGRFLKSDVLITAIEKGSLSPSHKFLTLAKPKMSLVSIENQNKFNRPSELIFKRIEKLSEKIYRTDKEGAILISSDGKNIKKINWKIF